jgi:predicted hotdog family 3-hydroxylacyl-ACP dehydratase
MANYTAINKAEIRALIPHSDLMCLLDEVFQWDDRSIVCGSNTHRDPANPLRRHGRLSAVHAFEYGAQAAAIHGGLRARAAGTVAPTRIFGCVARRTLTRNTTGLHPFALFGFRRGVFTAKAQTQFTSLSFRRRQFS